MSPGSFTFFGEVNADPVAAVRGLPKEISHFGPLAEKIVVDSGQLNDRCVSGLLGAEPLDRDIHFKQHGALATVANH